MDQGHADTEATGFVGVIGIESDTHELADFRKPCNLASGNRCANSVGSIMKSSRIPPPAWMLIFALAIWILSRYIPLAAIIPGEWRWLGWCVMALAPITPIAANVQFRRAQTTANPLKPETATALVTSGVFSWTRNPMYLGLSMLLLGWAIVFGALSSLIAALLFVPFIYMVQIRAEEYALRTRFGADYERYCNRVNRWLGRRRT